MKLCVKCKKRGVEDHGELGRSLQCGECNDRDIEHANERREWNHYHPSGDE